MSVDPLPDWGTSDPVEYALAAGRRGLAEHSPEEAARLHAEAFADVESPPPLPPDQAAALEAAVREDRPLVLLERRGPSYRVTAPEVGLDMTFRDVRTGGELSADVAVAIGGRHLFRTTTTLSLTARDKLSKTAAEFSGADSATIRRALFAAVEAVLAAEDQVGAPVDLRFGSLAPLAGSGNLVGRLWRDGSNVLNAPGDAGKSTIARALATSIAGRVRVLPGIEPVGPPRPVLYVAGEDPIAYWHAHSIEAICRGIGVDRSSLAQPIELFDARGRPLHRIARSIAERAADFGAIILDSQQALLAQADASGGIRDRDSLFWSAVDQLERPVLIIAHPNRADARDWSRADGRIAGSEVNRDRARMAWRAEWKDEAAVSGTSFRRYTLTNTKNNHGPKEPPIAFSAAWQFGYGDDDPGILRFMPAEPIRAVPKLSPELAEALAAYRDGTRTPKPLGELLNIPENTAKSRLRLLRNMDLLEDES